MPWRPQRIAGRRGVNWIALTSAALLAASTYFVRSALARVGLQGLTFVIPALIAAFCFGSLVATFAAVLTLAVVHLIIWQDNPQLLFTARYFSAMANYAVICGLIVLYTRRHEQMLDRLDRSLARETAARAEAEQASRLKDQFLATLSHELRTPINVILGYLQMLLTDRTANQQRVLQILDRNARHQARLIEDVLDASRITNGTLRLNLEEIDPAPLMREVVESLQPEINGKALHVVSDAPEGSVAIYGDAKRLRQVFWNILSNAIKFTPPRGSIAIRIQPRDGEVEISVSDSGRGISPEFLPHVFEMFRQGDSSPTREVSGMGLGLGLVKRFVELQGGTVVAESAGEGRGATFRCRFTNSRTTPPVALSAARSARV
ncbi:MAG TPA: HAMP domain-containing sensor histidine kinase [Vicinamibacterales bacterium]